MDRLPALILCALAIGCDDGAHRSRPTSRVESVAATQEDAEDVCEVRPASATLAFPTLASGAAPTAGAVRWVNAWATWCGPCVEEMPRLIRWSARMRAEGSPVDLVFLSADDSDEAIAAFRASHPDVPSSLRMASAADVPAWATSVGLDAGATLPIHVLADAQGRVRCARTGSIGEDDYDAMHRVIDSIAH